ncbi:RNA polymerase sigma factor [Anaerotignum lactatifermentans]|uniref:RNA polymerase sigma factor n=1 Tax=Anaerotignum lactatifermentans TaxID=160404 RepID=A0ABS2G667_9FIRM|nr:RNA polymerase sigma factor [Anaerotignum lactatifermentans]MBM6828883.1 RNA polymerase sigma factor [Anaerotignum lactatifermentans]MBM6876944.1 RNA polymerase sigma factor [Anaerotignum lactatifermentans]MBM6950502.1 RNA polymerase sigma factor [Anaerotignum lactatifermentans]
MTKDNTAALVRRMQAGDSQAFSELFAGFYKKAVRTAALLCGREALAEDVAQETFVICLMRIEDLKNPYAFETWFWKILTRNVWRLSEKGGRMVPMEEYMESGAEMAAAVYDSYPSEKQAKYDTLYDAIEHLGPKLKTAVVLYYYNQLSIREIAVVTSSLEATVKSRLFLAKRQIRKRLGAKNGRGDTL